ncbi:MAG: ABC transporter ATP-binding protein [Pseudoxanthomonas sp.]|jgi:putative spermidine/putrescine transport system ATP-binding protein|nr:ABC transporter ATP-binding protein [Pseudoxanthomonas sp.]MBP7655093.1 ABC transporter ATP-binding protein [Pseudoxanthomonas sp.]
MAAKTPPTNTTGDAFLSLRGLRKTFGPVVAIDNVSLDIRRGEFMTFLGPSGSGKSSTLYVVAGFQDPTEGSVMLERRSLLGVPPNQRNIGMVFQRYTLFPHLSVAENIAFPLRVRKQDDAQVRAKVAAMLKLVHLDGFGHRAPSELSGGQQQRVAIARALAYDPPVLLMDEPLSALDKKLRDELQTELRRIHQETGVTILYVTHDQEEALRLSDRIAVFNAGGIEQVGTGAELYEQPATRFVAGFIGNSNFMPVRIESRTGDEAELSLPDGQRLATRRLHCEARPGDKAALMVRPDGLRLEDGRPRSDDSISVNVHVRDMSYLGDSVQYLVSTPWQQEISVRQPLEQASQMRWRIGDNAHLLWQATRGQVFAEA